MALPWNWLSGGTISGARVSWYFVIMHPVVQIMNTVFLKEQVHDGAGLLISLAGDAEQL